LSRVVLPELRFWFCYSRSICGTSKFLASSSLVSASVQSSRSHCLLCFRWVFTAQAFHQLQECTINSGNLYITVSSAILQSGANRGHMSPVAISS